MYAYRAYNNATLRALAEEVWAQKNQFFITQSIAESGTHPNLTVGFSSECNGGEKRLCLGGHGHSLVCLVSVVGGIFNVSKVGVGRLQSNRPRPLRATKIAQITPWFVQKSWGKL